MSAVDVIILGLIIASTIYRSWQQRNPMTLYIMAGLTALVGVAGYIAFRAAETPYLIAIAILLGLLSFVLSKS
jgi:hypothetical protein